MVVNDVWVSDLVGDLWVQLVQLVVLYLLCDMVVDVLFGCFLVELVEYCCLVLLLEIVVLYEIYKCEVELQLLVKVISVMVLDVVQMEQLKVLLKCCFKCEIELEIQVDVLLLVGVVIDIGSEVIDGLVCGCFDWFVSVFMY